MVTMTKERLLTIDDLEAYSNSFLAENYSITLNIPIKRNNRLKRTLGYFKYSRDKMPLEINLAGKLLDYGTNSVILDILYHELIHYACFIQGMPHLDGEPYFENELSKHNISSSFTYLVGKYEIMQCLGCDDESITDTKNFINNPDEYHSTCCKADFKRIGYMITNGETEQKYYY